MTVTFVSSPHQTRDDILADPELQIIAQLIQVATEAGLRTDPGSIINLYVALKTKPLAILTGMAHGGKVELVRALAQSLIGDDPFRCQIMSGHAWWASQTGNVSLFADMQARLNSEKVLNLIEEAGRPENAQRVYLACLTHISPAELIGFFSGLACQLRHGQIMRLPSVHLTEPIAYPSNLLLIGTMDTSRFDWDDTDLLAQATIVPWAAIDTRSFPNCSVMVTAPNPGSTFLSSRICTEELARWKLTTILGCHTHCIQPVFQIMDHLSEKHDVLPDSVLGEATLYLANAWSKRGEGLFHPAMLHNAEMAMDRVIAQTILPYARCSAQALLTLKDQLRTMSELFPHSLGVLNTLTEVS